MIISLLQEKGGSGKTTISINLAHAIKRQGHRVLLVDSDPQGSARDWHTKNEGDVLDVIGLDRLTIDKDIKQFINQYDYIFIDGAPHLSTMITKSIILSDVVLIPVQPSPYDVWASSSIVSLIKQRQEITGRSPQTAFVISRRIVNTNIGREVEKVLVDYGLPIIPGGTCQRVSYAETAAKGMTVFMSLDEQARTEINLLATDVLEFIHAN
jgi:chromosome partitioning protein